MPIYEYTCNNCKTKFEILHKSTSKVDELICPNCNSTNIKKMLSVFSASTNSSNNYNSYCSDGNCIDTSSCCNNGMCGLN